MAGLHLHCTHTAFEGFLCNTRILVKEAITRNRYSAFVFSLPKLIDIISCAAFKDVDNQAGHSADISGLCLFNVGILRIRIAKKGQAVAIASLHLPDLRPGRV